ncbi:MAG TPA: malonyl-CoA synthase [Steroidobacteraceae bacterium]|nr:malonyl-CoA synthase [Steroidobacteraceae bacterium]
MNLYARIHASLQHHARKTLIETGERSISGEQLAADVGRFAGALFSLGVRPGDRVAVQVEKSYENVLLYLATLQAGAVYLPLNTAYQAQEVKYFLGDASPRVFVCTPQRAFDLRRVGTECGVEQVLTQGTQADGCFVEQAQRAAPLAAIVQRAPDDLASICYTSGTTGRSKGAMITHGNLLSNAETLVQLWGFTNEDVLLHALPLYHIHGLFVALHCALLSGATMLLQPKFDARSALHDLEQATVMMGVPTFYTRLLSEPGLDPAAVRNMRLFVSGSAPLLAETFNEFEQRTGQRILERYGMTETQMIASNPLHGERRPGTVGLPLPDVSVRIADDNGSPVARGEIGIVEVKGPNVCKGYWNMPEKTAAEIRADGHFITGDMGQLETDGYLRLVGRAKDLIISGGLNVYPKEIEEALDALDGVIESAVFAIPHPDFGEAVAAAVTLKPGATLTSEAIIATLRAQLATFKTPKVVYIVDELPRNAMSKVQKNVLRERYADRFRG